MNSSYLTTTEIKSPFLIGVAGGTACGKVSFVLLITFKYIIVLLYRVISLGKDAHYFRRFISFV